MRNKAELHNIHVIAKPRDACRPQHLRKLMVIILANVMGVHVNEAAATAGNLPRCVG
jgi:hypothetical protein